MLRERSRALATLVAIALVLAVAALIGDGAGAAPAKAAAITVPQPRQHIVVFVPHADDDALSMGVFIQAQERAGKDVTVVLYTDGAGTGVCNVVDDKCTAPFRYQGDSMAQFIALRDAEYRKAVTALGVPDDHVLIYTPAGRPRLHDGLVTVANMIDMLRFYNADPKYRDATFFTMSWLDHHQDHRSAGIALRELVTMGEIARDRALFTMARWYWAYDYPKRTEDLTQDSYYQRTSQGYPVAVQMMSCVGDTVCNDRLQASLEAYGPCPPDQLTQDQCTDIGYTSVPDFLTVARADPRIIIHSVDAAKYPTRLTVSAVSRPVGSARVDLAGKLVVPDYGRYGTDDQDPANAQYLVETVVSKDTVRPFDRGSKTTVTALDARQHVLAVTKLSLQPSGAFSGRVNVPAGAVSLSVYSDSTRGALPAGIVLPVQTQSVQFLRHAKSIKTHHMTVTGHYGQRIGLRVRPVLAGRLQRGVGAAIRYSSRVLSHATTSRAGYTTLTPTLTRSQTWHVATTSPAGTVPALATAIRTRVAAAVLKVRAARSTVHVHAKRVTLTGSVAGRNYSIAKRYLVPVKIRIYRQAAAGGKAVYVTSVRTAPGGRFTVSVPARKGQVITYRVVALPHTFATVKKAGSVKVA